MNKTDLFFETLVGVKERSNGQFIAKCFFHDDAHHSFSFNDEGLWKCFAGCGSGNAYQFAERMGKDPKPYIDNDKIKPKDAKKSLIGIPNGEYLTDQNGGFPSVVSS